MLRKKPRRVKAGDLEFWVGGIRYVVDGADFAEFLRRLGSHGYAGSLAEFEGLSDEEKMNFLEGYRIYSSGRVKKLDVYGRPVESPPAHSGGDVDIPMPV